MVVLLPCSCLNITLHLTAEPQKVDSASDPMLASLAEEADWGPVVCRAMLSIGGVAVQHESLLATRQIRGWKIHRCMNCCCDVYATHVNEQAVIAVNPVLTFVVRGQAAMPAPAPQHMRYSPSFHVMVDSEPPPLNDSAMPTAADPLSMDVFAMLQQQAQKYIEQEQKFMGRRIMAYIEQEEKQLERVKNQAFKDRNALWHKYIVHLREGSSSGGAKRRSNGPNFLLQPYPQNGGRTPTPPPLQMMPFPFGEQTPPPQAAVPVAPVLLARSTGAGPPPTDLQTRVFSPNPPSPLLGTLPATGNVVTVAPPPSSSVKDRDTVFEFDEEIEPVGSPSAPGLSGSFIPKTSVPERAPLKTNALAMTVAEEEEAAIEEELEEEEEAAQRRRPRASEDEEDSTRHIDGSESPQGSAAGPVMGAARAKHISVKSSQIQASTTTATVSSPQRESSRPISGHRSPRGSTDASAVGPGLCIVGETPTATSSSFTSMIYSTSMPMAVPLSNRAKVKNSRADQARAENAAAAVLSMTSKGFVLQKHGASVANPGGEGPLRRPGWSSPSASIALNAEDVAGKQDDIAMDLARSFIVPVSSSKNTRAAGLHL